MEERALGATDLWVSRIGIGLAAVGRPAYINLGREADLGHDRTIDALRRRTHALLDAATGAGVRYVDVARSYGLAESFLGSWLDRLPANVRVPTVGSKWGYTYIGDWRLDASIHEVKDHSLGAFRRQMAESLAILGDRLALYQIHSATLESGVLEDRDLLVRLGHLRERGVVAGLSVSGPRQAEVVRRALDVRVDGQSPFGTVQATWNVLESSVGTALRDAHAAGWGVIVKEALANGRLARPESCPPALAAIAQRRGVATDAVAIAAVLAQPWVDVALSGAVTEAQLGSNLAGVDLALNDGELDELMALREPADTYWAARSARAWE